MPTRRITITVEGQGRGADAALARLCEALRLSVGPDALQPEPPRAPSRPRLVVAEPESES